MPEIREALMSVGSGSWCFNCSKLSLSFPVCHEESGMASDKPVRYQTCALELEELVGFYPT